MSERTLLLVDDDQEFLLSLARSLGQQQLEARIVAASSAQKAASMALEEQPAVVVMDLCLVPQRGVESGFQLLRELTEQLPNTRFIMLTGNAEVTNGVRALQLGASNFLEKPAHIPHLAALIKDAFQQVALRKAYQQVLQQQGPPEAGLVGVSAAIQSLRERVLFAARTAQPVLILGETGTGKGVTARLIHSLSARSAERFVRYQPSFAGHDLVASELFGHVRGAFTGAEANRQGLLTEVAQGTLFLDEVDQLPLQTQVLLLGVLQERVFRTLGNSKEQPCNFRLICATNAEPTRCVEEGRMRADFYHRLAHFCLRVPPLRERLEDLPALCDSLLRRIFEREGLASITVGDDAYERLRSYAWPGNVRELEATLEGAVWRATLAQRHVLVAQDIELQSHQEGAQPGSSKASFSQQVEALKRELVKQALSRHAGNQVQAARELGIDRATLRRLM
jgi:two-component system response regulator PilR (NtrC family)